MENKAKTFFLLMILIFVSGGAVYYFSGKFLQKEQIETEAGSQASLEAEKTEPVDMEALSAEYEKEAVNIIKNYEALSQTKEASIDDESIEKLKNWKDLLLSKKVPFKYKELHLNLVLLLSDPRQLESGQGAKNIQTAKNTYEWLN